MSAEPAMPGGWKQAFLGSSFGIGLVTVALTVPVMLLVPRHRAWLVAFLVLCVYPVLDAPRNASRPSWLLGAIFSTVVWFGVTGILVGVADARHPLHESSMVFVVPSTMFPLVLLVSGLVRLYRRRRGQPREAGGRVAALLGGAICFLMIGVPAAVHTVEEMTDTSTENTPPNIVFPGRRAEVGQADAQEVMLRNAGPGPRTFRLTPETRYAFLGTGKHPDDSKAGPDWLKPGQSVTVDYVFRNHVAQARRISIWIDRTAPPSSSR